MSNIKKDKLEEIHSLVSSLQDNPRFKHSCPKCSYVWSSVVKHPKKCPKCQKVL